MRPSIIRDEAGVSSWVWISGGGLVIVFAFVFFLFSKASDPLGEVDQITQISLNESGEPDPIFEDPPVVVTPDVDRLGGFGQRHTDGFGDIQPLETPAVGNFEFVTPTFEPLGQISPDARTHIIVASNGDPSIASYFPIGIDVFDPVTGGGIWNDVIDGPAEQVCRDNTGCSIDGPSLAELLALFPEGRYMFQASSGDQLLAESAWLPSPDGSGDYSIDADLRQLEQDIISGRVTIQGR